MRLVTLVRGAAASAGAAIVGASPVRPALAASAQQSIVPIGSLDGSWSTLHQGSDATAGLDNYTAVFQRSDGMTAAVMLMVLPSPAMAQQVVQGVIDSQKAKMTPDTFFVPSTTYGDANGWEVTGADASTVTQGRLFVDKGTLVYVVATGTTGSASDVKTTADTLANAQDNILPSA